MREMLYRPPRSTVIDCGSISGALAQRLVPLPSTAKLPAYWLSSTEDTVTVLFNAMLPGVGLVGPLVSTGPPPKSSAGVMMLLRTQVPASFSLLVVQLVPPQVLVFHTAPVLKSSL